mmetsp:Transcript_25338/g.67191  ORF Transcript_25338/g.67191 Transcript_25338/m.67191 type:complete len:117 (+) Transcript_25338:35-385(+)|eukprot:CAMPEP_0113687218 /NCGR_PEP_ID=MMETSP0038_2-20120614/15795_1 /TAXON_ID=2898 /ORGANISM="Cryptomonas paramecium" /LENGTH=116 /DNA_ID=CAMNT_0000607771 /DNA_START=1 /DNA_END=351 /DNA_ORIENTATION=- /assembly_acc=CAM_ASM_000170
MQSTFNYPEGSHQLKEMEDDASFLTSTYVIHLKRSKGLGEGVAGYGLHLTPTDLGPKVVRVTEGGEAHRTGLISIGDVIVEVDGIPTKGVDFQQVMGMIVSRDSCSFTMAGPPFGK